ncbi:MAG: flagellar hook-basal body complex protein FliE [Rhizobiaceae bacterium]|nr:flagellar hook-basal body complex protein FliE [Rhizobiaceae bacterium]
MTIGAITALDLLSSARSVSSAPRSEPQAEAASATSFSAALSRAAGGTVDKMQAAEALAVDGLQGNADMRAVVDAVMDAEQSLKAAISIRDKIVQSYLEVSRMAI